MMTFITIDEAQQRVDENLVVFAFEDATNDEDYSMVNINSSEPLVDHYDENARFGYDKEVEQEAEEIFNSLRDEVKEYLYRLLLAENNPLFN